MSVEFTMGATGLATLTWNGLDVLSPAGNCPAVIDMYGRAQDGRSSEWLGNAPASVNAAGDRVTLTFGWGLVTVRYIACADRLMIEVAIENQTANMIFDRYRIYALALMFPEIPSDTSNAAAFNIDAPSSVFRASASLAADLANEDPEGALGLGYWQVTNPPDASWFVQLFADPGQHINPNWPSVVRPVGPYGSVTFRTSLRFGPADATEEDLAGDVFRRYRRAFPMLLTQPEPKQPIARLSYNGAFRPSFPSNPRGWFNDANVDVTTPGGIAQFQARLLSAADSSIAEMRRVGASGGVIWDIEGQQLDQSYIGDPALAEILAPELIGVLDAFVFRIRDAGLRVGFTLRPQTFDVKLGVIDVAGTEVTWKSGAKFSPAWVTDLRSAGALAFGVNNYRIASVESDTELTLATDAGSLDNVEYFYAAQTNEAHFAAMRGKAQYCYRRWGARLFYVDTTVGYTGNITPGRDFEQLAAEFPDCMFFPEWKSTRHYASTWPWTDSTRGYIFPSRQALSTYPAAAGLVRVPGDGEIDAVEADLTEAVREGNILLFDGWYQHHANDVVMRCYQAAGAL
jgi:hypothetical protein